MTRELFAKIWNKMTRAEGSIGHFGHSAPLKFGLSEHYLFFISFISSDFEERQDTAQFPAKVRTRSLLTGLLLTSEILFTSKGTFLSSWC
jgi:hypothetical protein